MRVLLAVLLVGIAGCGLETPTAMTEFNKGVEFADQGDYDTAIACYIKAIRINPNLAVTHFNLGMAYYKGEEYGDASMAFDNFAKLFPDDTLTSDALFWAGESYRQGNQQQLVDTRFRNAVQYFGHSYEGITRTKLHAYRHQQQRKHNHPHQRILQTRHRTSTETS